MKHLFIIIFFFASFYVAKAQESGPTIQPKVMVIPRVNSSQSIVRVYENNSLVRLSISLIKEAFNERGFPTIDFMSKIRTDQRDDAMEIENQSDYKQELIESSGADIYIEVDNSIDRSSSSGNNVTIILSAFDAYTSISLANKSFVSPRFFTESFDNLVHKAVEENIDEFMNQIQNSFEDIVSNGRMVAMNISFAEDSEYNMDYEVGDFEMLSDKIESWLESNAYKGYFHVQGITSTKMIVDEIRVPLKDENENNFRVSKFVQSFRKYLHELGISSTRDLQGGKIFITIN